MVIKIEYYQILYSIDMKSFSILQTLIYNPTLKSSKKKPIQSDIQQAKIVAYIPNDAQIQQKCNTVGMAEGVYEFSRSLLTEQQRQQSPRQLVIFMDNCCLVQKEYQQNTWLFIKIAYEQPQFTYTKYNQEQQNTYIDSIITEQLAINILDHIYMSFKIFYGPFNAFIFQKRQQQLSKLLCDFLISYHEINKVEELKKLDISTYLFNSIRALPLDVNSTLKFNYFKNVLETYDQNMQQIMIFSNGLLAYSSLPKQISTFFQTYFYGTGEPFRYDFNAFNKRIKLISDISLIKSSKKYGNFFNTINFGLGNADNTITDSRLTSNLGLKKTLSATSPSKSQPGNIQQDLLGLSEAESLQFPQVYLTKNGQQNKYVMTYFQEKKMLFVTFYKTLTTREQVVFQNRFYYDNIGKFSHKINQLLNGILSQVDSYRFLYCNLNTFNGKISIQKWNVFVPEMRYIWEIMSNNKQSLVVTTIQNHWIYGIHRLNRVLALMVPSQVPLHKLDEFADKMFKQYFVKAYM